MDPVSSQGARVPHEESPFQQTLKRAFQKVTESVVPAFSAVATYHPLSTLKTMVQEGKIANMSEAFRMARSNPGLFYRGFFTNMGSVPPLAFMGFVNQQVAETYAQHVMRPLTDKEKLAFSAGASSVGGVFVTISEQVIIQQQLSGLSFFASARFVAQNGVRGTAVTVGRETGFGTFMFGVIPVMQKKFRELMPDSWGKSGDFAAAFLSSNTGGVVGAAATQPLDVIKTKVQANSTMTYSTAVKTIAEAGFKGFFKGLGPRTMGFVVVANVMTVSRMVLERVFDKKQN